MKLLFFTDSHGYTLAMHDAIGREAPDAVVHLGDYAEDARELVHAYPTMTIYRVRGNNDYGAEEALSAVIRPDGIPIYITHGHRERVGMMHCGIVPQAARENGCALAFFGHTHRMMLEQIDGVTVCNPGSISLPRGGPASYACLYTENSHVMQLDLLTEESKLLKRKIWKR